MFVLPLARCVCSCFHRRSRSGLCRTTRRTRSSPTRGSAPPRKSAATQAQPSSSGSNRFHSTAFAISNSCRFAVCKMSTCTRTHSSDWSTWRSATSPASRSSIPKRMLCWPTFSTCAFRFVLCHCELILPVCSYWACITRLCWACSSIPITTSTCSEPIAERSSFAIEKACSSRHSPRFCSLG